MDASPRPESGLNLFEFQDYRLYLREYYQARKERQTGWGLRPWAAALGLKSKSTLAMLLSGQRHPSRDLTSSLCRYFGFTVSEHDYFCDLVEFEKSRGKGDVGLLLQERLAKKRKTGQFGRLDLDQFAMLSEWQFSVLRELFNVEGFRLSSDWISRQLNGAVSPREVKRAFRLFFRMGILKHSPDGRIELCHPDLSTDSDLANEAVRRFHRQMLHKASESLQSIPVEEREVVGCTLAVRQDDLPKAKRLLRDFANQFADSVEARPGERVYHLEICFFPVSIKRGTP